MCCLIQCATHEKQKLVSKGDNYETRVFSGVFLIVSRVSGDDAPFVCEDNSLQDVDFTALLSSMSALSVLSEVHVELDCDSRGIFGSLSSDAGNLSVLTSLMTMDLSYNDLSGSIPSQLMGSSGIKVATNLFLNGNRLTGSIPTQISFLNKLTKFDVSDNLLASQVQSFQVPPKAEFINYANNSLFGTISSGLRFMTTLTHLDFSDN